MSDDLDFPAAEGPPDAFFTELAGDIAGPSDGPTFSITLVIAIAQLLFSVYQACKPDKITRVVNQAHARPHGAAAGRVRRLLARLPDQYQGDDRLAARTVAAAHARVSDPAVWCPRTGLVR